MSEPAPNRNDTAVSTGAVTTRLSWALWILAMTIGASGLVLLALNRSTPVHLPWGFRGFQLSYAIPTATVGALIAWRRPRNPIGWILLAGGFLGSLAGLSEEYAVYTLLTRPGVLAGGVLIAGVGHWLWVPAYGLLSIHTPLLFPNGRFLTPRWRVIAWLGAAWIVLGSLWLFIHPGPLENISFVVNPFGVEELKAGLFWSLPQSVAILGPGVLLMAAAAASLAFRFRQSGEEVRQQLKWLAYAATLMPLIGIVGQFDGLIPNLLLFIFTAAFPVAMGIAILRYRLYDIDLLINRTLVYGVMTVSVIALYVLVVGGLGLLFQSTDSLLIPLLATGLAAALFQPLRQRLQGGVNRMMYGKRDEPAVVLAKLSEQLERTGSSETTLARLVETVALALKLPYTAVTLEDETEPIASFGIPTTRLQKFPLIYQGKLAGQMLVAGRPPDGELTAKDIQLLENIALQTGVVAHNARLTTDLRHSRQKLVTTREEERRRLRRDLHDGLGPTLAAHMLKIGSARALLRRDPATADRLLMELETNIETTLADVRRLVYNLRPPALDQWGLAGAVRAYAAACENEEMNGNRQKLIVKIDAPNKLPPLSAAVEVAAYHIAREGLTNVVRHAQAQHCTVKLVLDEGGRGMENGRLHLTIHDDGKGLPDTIHKGIGFASMRERAEELGGNCIIKSANNEGTRVTAVLPLGSISQ